MSKMIKAWKGTGYSEAARLFQYQYSDGTTNHFTFYPRVGTPGNPTLKEAEKIIKEWRMEEIKL